MNCVRFSLLALVAYLFGTLACYSVELSTLTEAAGTVHFYDSVISAKPPWPHRLQPEDREQIQQAEKLLLAHRTELMKAVEKKENDWNILAYGLRRSKDPEITAFFIRLVQQNLYVKDANGNRMKFGFGSSHGCEEITNELGSGLAIHLGEIGGKRAVTALKEAVEQGDSAVRDGAYRALYKLGEYSFEEILSMLGAISFDEKFGMNVTNSVGLSPNTVMAIIEDVEALDYKCANKLFDRIIEKFPAGSDQVARAHFSKILSYRQHEQFDLALRQCEVALQKGKLRDYAVRISEIRSDIIKGAQQSSANHPAKAPESKSEGK